MKNLFRSILVLAMGVLTICPPLFAYTSAPDTWIGATDATYANQFKWSTIEDVTTPADVVNIQQPNFTTEIGIYVTFPDADFDAVYFNNTLQADGSGYKQSGAGICFHLSALTAQNTEILIKRSGTTRFGLNIYNDKGSDKTNPSLTLDTYAVTIDAEDSETHQIVASRSGDGAITYSSSNTGVAIVSASGLVTAVGAGNVNISVSVAETETYAPASATLAVTVTGPLNWAGLDWLNGSGNKYKAAVSPSGPNIVNVQTRNSKQSIYVTFASADFGACSLDAEDYDTEGAGKFFYTSAFTSQVTEFTQVCAGTTYTISVYYADGEPEDLTGWNLARGKTAAAGYSATPAANAIDGNKGTRWGSEGGTHYATVGASAQDWFYVDLGGLYSIDQVKILFETAAPTDYDLLISNNGSSWTVIGTYNATPKTGNTENDYNEYNFTDKVGRYVKIFARDGYNSLGYGISIWEFEVYGDRAENTDTNPPTMTSASVNGSPTYNEVRLNVVGTDSEDGAVTTFRVVDALHSVDRSISAVAGVITITGLTAETTYNFTVTALDNAGNESENNVIVAATTAQDPTIPSTSAPTPPDRNEGVTGDVRPLYSDAYSLILAHSFALQNWGSVAGSERSISDDHYLLYDVSTGNAVIWGENNAGSNAIVANAGYNAGGDGDNTGIDVSGMTYLHIDIWSIVAMSNIEIRINDNLLRRINVSNTGWQQFKIELADPLETCNTSSVRWIKITNIVDANRQKMAFDNIYFYNDPSDTEKPVMTAASLYSISGLTATLNVSATDNYEVASFHIVDSDNSVDQNLLPVNGKVTVTGLTGGTSYHFTIRAKDPAGNESANSIIVNATTLVDHPTATAPTPEYDASIVKAMYSAAYSATTMSFGEWGSGTVFTDDTYGKKYVMNSSGYFGNQIANLDCSDMTVMHIDIWSAVDASFKVTPILWNTSANANYAEKPVTVSIVGGEWNTINLPLNEGNLANYTDWTNFYQLKISEAPNLTLWLDNIYFTKHLDLPENITTETLADLDGKTIDADVDREMQADGFFKTICFPFAMSEEQVAETFDDCEILRLNEARMKANGDIYVRYAAVTSIEAGYPYLITLTGDDQDRLDFSAVTINSATTNNTISMDLGEGKAFEMIGTFVALARSAENEYYLDATDNMLHSIGLYCSEQSAASLTIPAFRCYFRLTGFGGASAPSRARIVFGQDTATEAEATSVESLAPVKKISNGQLLILREGKCYDVLGRSVK